MHIKEPSSDKKEDVGTLWEENAEAWSELARLGYDIYRDGVNSPSFLAELPSVSGLIGLDVGCGEGENTRRVARLGAQMFAVDISRTFVRYAAEKEEAEPLGIQYGTASGAQLAFPDEYFDFVISTMALMDMEDLEGALRAIYRVLKPKGFFQFSIVHPCFQTPGMRWIEDDQGTRTAVVASRYFEEGRIDDEWSFSAAPESIRNQYKPFRVAHFHKTLSTWINLLIDTGFTIRRMHEPCPTLESVTSYPPLGCMLNVPLFLHARVEK